MRIVGELAKLHPGDEQLNAVSMAEGTVGPTAKRQRRPNVRLGDIGGDASLSYDNHPHQQRRGSSKQHYQRKQYHAPGKGSKQKSNETLALTLVESKNGENNIENEGEDNERDLDLDKVAIGSWKTFRRASKTKRGREGSVRKRVRSNWVSSKIDENEKLLTSGDEGDADGEGEGDFNLDNDDGTNRDFQSENTEEEVEEKNGSPVHSFEDNDVDLNGEREGGNARGVEFHNKSQRRLNRVSDEMEAPSDTIGKNGVKVWLEQLGLGRYAPVFEIHEVDDEVLPMLTLQDLKDMGINVVGSRRKMYCSIQKLNRGFW